MANLDKVRYANGRTPTADLRMNMQKVGSVKLTRRVTTKSACSRRSVSWGAAQTTASEN